jgi:NAD(P)-dependent dehydrogenase (short-subunit alcohol dehydrogenase family)
MSSPSRIILITGANKGIGLALARQISLDRPDNHILLGTRCLANGEAALTKLNNPANISLVQLDVTSDDSIAKAAEHIASKFGRLDLLINNSGIGPQFTGSPREQWHAVLDVNIIGAALLTDALAPLLAKSSNPGVIMVSSELGSVEWCLTSPFWVDTPQYSVSKAGMNVLQAVLNRRYSGEAGFDTLGTKRVAGKQWKVNSLNPGYTATDLHGRYDDPNANSVEKCAEAAVRLVYVMEKEDGPRGINWAPYGIAPW